MKKSKRIVVTGGAGYIGSHVVRQLLNAGYSCTVIDDLSTGFVWAIDKRADFLESDISDTTKIATALNKADAILHFAASVVVPDSVEKPLDYYHNNSAKTLQLLQACVEAQIDKFIFSSTAAVYGLGRADNSAIVESDTLAPINPYGASKMMSERFLEDLTRTRALRYISLRYFNVAGAHPDGSLGQATAKATHLIKVACQTALNKRNSMAVYGTDYPTQDGTCVRDYIHVQDLAKAHILALESLISGATSDVFNCGYGHGTSVQEIIELTRSISGNDFPAENASRRLGDPPILVANSNKIRKKLGWQPDFDNTEVIITHALQWEQQLVNQETR